MTIHHHPSDESMLALVAGRLRPGPSLVLSTHLTGCPVCRGRSQQLMSVGAVLLEQFEPAPLSSGSLQRVLARIDQPDSVANPAPPARSGRERDQSRKLAALAAKSAQLGVELPASLANCDIGPWRRMAPGVRWSKLKLANDPYGRLMLLRIAAGSRLLIHGHSGIEFTQVLSGSYHDGRARFGVGDFDEADDEVDHQPVVDSSAECICLAAVDGRMLFQSPLARGLGWLVGL